MLCWPTVVSARPKRFIFVCIVLLQDPDQGQRDHIRRRRGLLPGPGRHHEHCQRRERGRRDSAAGPDHPQEHAGHQELVRGSH